MTPLDKTENSKNKASESIFTARVESIFYPDDTTVIKQTATHHARVAAILNIPILDAELKLQNRPNREKFELHLYQRMDYAQQVYVLETQVGGMTSFRFFDHSRGAPITSLRARVSSHLTLMQIDIAFSLTPNKEVVRFIRHLHDQRGIFYIANGTIVKGGDGSVTYGGNPQILSENEVGDDGRAHSIDSHGLNDPDMQKILESLSSLYSDRTL